VSTKSTSSSRRRLRVRIASDLSMGRTPDAGASDAHRSEAEAVDLEVATDFEWARFAGIQFGAYCSPRRLALRSMSQ